MSHSEPVLETYFPELSLLSRGKVRDLYDLGDSLLIVATDRISAFDVVMPTAIPDKGKVLNQISAFWFRFFDGMVEHHMITTDTGRFPDSCRPYHHVLRGRSMLVRKAQPVPVECIVRGYLVGSGWSDYKRTGRICGIRLPEGIRQAQRLPEPIFTPSTKAERGNHDENITFEELVTMVGKGLAEEMKRISMLVYEKAASYAYQRGIILADTKLEFGLCNGRLILIDELLTPDSSRFWSVEDYRIGTSPNSFDKQYVRDYLIACGWKRDLPPPKLPPDIVENTRNRYLEALMRLTGKGLEE